MTPSSVDKGEVNPADLLEVDEGGELLHGQGKPSAERLIHVVLARSFGAGAVLHTHSVANTALSFRPHLVLEGYEMLKALEGVQTHEHREQIPIFDNSQDMPAFSKMLAGALPSDAHCFLMRGHGLYTWGPTLGDAKRHVEALEFLFEVEMRRKAMG
jgi:methylthioribulose-1-phosphate dehydratase